MKILVVGGTYEGEPKNLIFLTDGVREKSWEPPLGFCLAFQIAAPGSAEGQRILDAFNKAELSPPCAFKVETVYFFAPHITVNIDAKMRVSGMWYG